MKIGEVTGNSPNMPGISGHEDRKVSDSKEANFQSQLRYAEASNLEERLNDMANAVVKQGEKLGKNVDIRELKLYKQMVSEFLNEVVSNSHKFSKKNFLDRRGRHRVYAVVKKVNEEIELLAKDVLSSQKDNIGVLKRLDDIRGLILDLVM